MQSSAGHPSDVSSYRLNEVFTRWVKLSIAPPSVEHGTIFALLSNFLRHLEQNLHFDYFSFGLYDRNKEAVASVFEAGEFRLPAEVPVQESSLAIVLHDQQAIEVADIQAESRFPDLVKLAATGGLRSFRIVPVSNNGHRLGTLGVARRRPGAFSDPDARNLDHAAQLFALVLQNAFLAEVLATEKQRLETLLDITTSLN